MIRARFGHDSGHDSESQFWGDSSCVVALNLSCVK